MVVPIGDKDDIVRGLRGRYGALLAHRSADEIYAAAARNVAPGRRIGGPRT